MFKTNVRFGLVVAAALQAGGPSNAVAQQSITAETIRAALSRNTMTSPVPGGFVDLHFLGDGTLKFSSRVNNTVDTGVWRIDGTAFCTKYQKVRQGQENCYSVVGLSDDSVVVRPPNGGISESKLQKGNPLGL